MPLRAEWFLPPGMSVREAFCRHDSGVYRAPSRNRWEIAQQPNISGPLVRKNEMIRCETIDGGWRRVVKSGEIGWLSVVKGISRLACRSW